MKYLTVITEIPHCNNLTVITEIPTVITEIPHCNN